MLRNEPVRQARSPRFRCDGRNHRRHLYNCQSQVLRRREDKASGGFLDYSGACTDGQILYGKHRQKRVGRTTAAALRVG